jgi:hypothetical protein
MTNDRRLFFREVLTLADGDRKQKNTPPQGNESDRLTEIAEIIFKMPPESLLEKYHDLAFRKAFLWNKRYYFHVWAIIAAKARGEYPVYKIPPDIDELARDYAAYLQCEYNLLFECWKTLESLAVEEGFLDKYSQPKDAFREIQYQSFEIVTADIENGKVKATMSSDLDIRTIAQIRRSWDEGLESISPLLALLFKVANKRAKTDRVTKDALLATQAAMNTTLSATINFARKHR